MNELKRKKLSEVADIIMGQSPPGSSYNENKEGIPLINGPTEFNKRYPQKIQWTTEPTKICNEGDILICVRGSSTGRINIANDEYCIGRGVAAICGTTDTSTTYLEYLLDLEVDKILKLTSGSTFPNITSTALKNISLLYHSKSEQEHIVEILSSWDEAISKTEKLINAKKRYKKGLMQRLLSGRVRFPEFEGEDWVEKRLGKVVKQVKRKVPKPEEDYLSIGIRSHGNGTFQKPNKDPDDNSMTSLYKVKEDDLIVNITFAWEGAIAIVKKEDSGGYVSHRFPTYEFDTSKLIPEYFQYVITQPWFVYKLGLISPGGAGRNRVLNKKDFLKLKIDTPSVFEQKAIAGVLTTVDKEIELLELQLKKCQEQKKGLMQQLLTGKVRVN